MPEKKSKEVLRNIFETALEAVSPKEVIRRSIKLGECRSGTKLILQDREYSLADYKRIYVIGAGKASCSMAHSIEEILGDRITKGTVITKYGYRERLKRITIHEAGHPIPDEAGMKATRDLLSIVNGLTSRDLVLCLISGGGSALMPLPCEDITLLEKQNTTKLLLECGATINEINAIRKHISQIKGGRLSRAVHPATLITLILSDVVGDRLDVIASGPTVEDESSFQDCLKVIEKYDLKDRVPTSVYSHLIEGSLGRREETPKQGDLAFEKTVNMIIGNNLLAINEANKKAQELGYTPLILSSCIEGETKEVAKVHAAIAKEVLNSGNPVKVPACLISGGETTVTLFGDGLGGRNQEFVLAAAIEIDGLQGITVLSGGTDGTDGPTDAAGALADWASVQRAKELNMDPYLYVKNNDSYTFFQRLGDLLVTGPTNTNVMDLRLIIIE